MDLLNLDELVELERHVNIRGVEYAVVERSVGVLLDSIKVAKSVAKKNRNEEEFFESMIRTIRTIIPECPEEVVRGLTMAQMLAVFEFANRDPQKMAEEAVNDQAARAENGEVVVTEKS